MCGVVAVVAPLSVSDREALAQQLIDRLAHRGPDGQGLCSRGGPAGVTLGHRRLAILDRSPTGAQPMQRGDLTISYNGEFYNYVEKRAELAARGHSFVGSSDTEVLLALCQQHGVPEALRQVNGMFALALFDEQKGRLWLARDRFGEKPLYYLLRRDICLVASEPKAILHAAHRLKLPIGVNREVLACYLADTEHEVGTATFFSQIQRVRPGEWLCIERRSDGVLQRSAGLYYEVSPELCPKSHGPSADEELRTLLYDALRLRLRSDVPVAACLSGGLDSSSLVGIAAQSGQRLHTFSAVHQPGEPWDEREFIAAVVAHTGVENATVDPATWLAAPGGAASFAAFIAQHDEPVGGPSVWAQHAVYRLLAQHGHRVALSGQGADECLGGYGGTLPALRADLLQHGDWPGLATELSALPSLASRAHGLRQAVTTALREALATKSPASYQAWLAARWQQRFLHARYFDLDALAISCPPLPPVPRYAADFDRRSRLHGYLYRLLVGPSLGTILRYEDRNSMAASVEARAPFLDPRIVAHCLGRPAHELAGHGFTKLLLRRNLAVELPKLVRFRRDKVGFATPPWRWLTGPLRPFIADVLSSSTLRSLPFLRRERMQADFAAAVAAERAGQVRGNSDGFWRALNVALWLDGQRLGL